VAGVRLENRFRYSDLSGRFVGVFPFSVDDRATSYTLASGPNKGQTWTGIGARVALFNTELNDLGSISNDLRFTKTFGLGGSDKVDLTGGVFYNDQNVSTTWHFNHYQLQVVGSNPALLAGGTADANGLVSFGAKDWGYCCQRIYDLSYKTVSPYLNLGYQTGALNLDAGVRFDRQDAEGVYFQADASGVTEANPRNIRYSSTPTQSVDYSKSNTSFTFGGTYRLNRDLSVFARYSDGVAFKADRIIGFSKLDGSDPIAIDKVRQAEVGVKMRSGPLSLAATLFNANTDEAGGFEATTQKIIENSYKATGLELEAAFSAGNFRIAGGVTFTDAEITDSNDKTVIGNTPRRQAKMIYQLTPSYTMGPVEFGAAIIGTTKSFSQDDNKVTMDGFAVINAFVNWNALPNLTVGLGVNNLSNAIGYTESEGSVARSVNGRAVKATVKYTF
jgi:outer membrane receptor protein involved in Fe transport